MGVCMELRLNMMSLQTLLKIEDDATSFEKQK
jgi:hypothetical protein